MRIFNNLVVQLCKNIGPVSAEIILQENFGER